MRMLMVRFALMMLLLLPGLALAQQGASVQISGSRNDAAVSVGHSHSSAATITLTGVTGQYIYIIGLDISNCAGGTAVTAAAATYITTTGLTGNPQYQVGSGTTAGACQVPPSIEFTAPLRSASTGSNVTFVLPTFATNQVISLNVYYYTAP